MTNITKNTEYIQLTRTESQEDLRRVFLPDLDRALATVRQLSTYRETPLSATRDNDDNRIWIKDETNRMGLGSFKALGGIHAVAHMLLEQCEQIVGKTLEISALLDSSLVEITRRQTFVAATAGNHGLAVATGAQLFGAQARLHIPKTCPDSFASRIRSLGADVVCTCDTYEAACGSAIEDAKISNGILIADFSTSDNEKAPALVMEGYQVLAEELRTAFEALNKWPTHLFLQAGVGSFAAAITDHVRSNWAVQPKIVIVEADKAACLKASHDAGRLVSASKGGYSVMHRLDCKVPSSSAVRILANAGVQYSTITDRESIAATALLSDIGIATTPSGAAGYAAALNVLSSSKKPTSLRPLVIVTEGSESNHY